MKCRSNGQVEYCCLDMIIAVSYRVKSQVTTRFGQRLSISKKGFVLDCERFSFITLFFISQIRSKHRYRCRCKSAG
jgi:hypothetical protein